MQIKESLPTEKLSTKGRGKLTKNPQFYQSDLCPAGDIKDKQLNEQVIFLKKTNKRFTKEPGKEEEEQFPEGDGGDIYERGREEVDEGDQEGTAEEDVEEAPVARGTIMIYKKIHYILQANPRCLLILYLINITL